MSGVPTAAHAPYALWRAITALDSPGAGAAPLRFAPIPVPPGSKTAGSLLRGRVRFAERRGSSTVSGASPSVLMTCGEACRALADSTLKGRYSRL